MTPSRVQADPAPGAAIDAVAVGDELIAVRRTTGRTNPRKKSKKLFVVKKGERLSLIRRGKKWVKVQTDHDDIGWIRRSAVEPFDSSESPPETFDPEPSVVDEPEERPFGSLPERLEIAAFAGAGFSTYSRRFSSNGESALGGYTIKAPTMSAEMNLRVRKQFGRLAVGGRLRYATSLGAPGIRFENVDGELSDPSRFHTHQVGGVAELGTTLRFGHPVRIAALVGYDVRYFVVSKIQRNPGLLARERLAGPMVGASLETNVSAEVTVAADLAWTPRASLEQTTNLADGMESSVWSIGGGALASYRISESYAAQLAYRGRRIRYKFSGQSSRQFDVTKAFRKDIVHAAIASFGRTF